MSNSQTIRNRVQRLEDKGGYKSQPIKHEIYFVSPDGEVRYGYTITYGGSSQRSMG